MVGFENRSGATLLVVSTGIAEGRHLQPGMEKIRSQTTLVEPRGIEPLTSSLRTTRSPI